MISSLLESPDVLLDLLLQFAVLALSLLAGVEVAEVAVVAHGVQLGGVGPVLDLHARVLGHIHVVTPGLVLLEVVLHAHEHVECLVGLGLAVLNAGHVRLVLGSSELEVHAVLVALLEQHLRKSMLLQTLSLVVGISTPVRCHYFN